MENKNTYKPELSVVTTLYNSALFIEDFVERMVTAIRTNGISSYEIIIVNDGSPDHSVELIREQLEKYSNLVLIDLSRNFGHHKAFQAGMEYASGDMVFNIDSDLETDPAVLTDFINIYRAKDFDVVYGFQEKRKGGFFEKVSGHIFWLLIKKLSRIDIPQNITTERLMSRRYVDALLRLKESAPFIGGLMYWVGFDQKGIPVKRRIRKGKSNYSIRKKANLLLDAVTSLSAYPLRLVFKFGFWMCLTSFLILLAIVLRKILFPESILMGYTSLVSILLFTFGLLIMAVGIVGIYLERVFNESKNRPNYIIKEIKRSPSDGKPQ